MQERQISGIDLPVKALAWEDADGAALACLQRRALPIAKRHGLRRREQQAVEAIAAGDDESHVAACHGRGDKGGTAMTTSGEIRAGMGGWTFEPWDTSFYPEKLSKAKQLQYASRQVPTIEVNGTYYSTFKPPTFAKWASEAPDGFVYSLKGIRFVTNRRVLADAGESVMRFLGSGISELGDKLGPILWQFAPTKKFEEDDFGAFLKLLPEKQDGVKLRHVIEVRNHSFVVPEFAALLGNTTCRWFMPTTPNTPALPT